MADGPEVDCTPLVTWLPVALIQDVHNISVLASPAPLAPVAYTALLEYRYGLVLDDFPELSTATTTRDTHAIATNLSVLIADQRTVPRDEAAGKAADRIKPVSTLLGSQVNDFADVMPRCYCTGPPANMATTEFSK